MESDCQNNFGMDDRGKWRLAVAERLMEISQLRSGWWRSIINFRAGRHHGIGRMFSSVLAASLQRPCSPIAASLQARCRVAADTGCKPSKITTGLAPDIHKQIELLRAKRVPAPDNLSPEPAASPA